MYERYHGILSIAANAPQWTLLDSTDSGLSDEIIKYNNKGQ